VSPFLLDVTVDDKTFTVMFRWLSATRKATWDPENKTRALEAVHRDDTANQDAKKPTTEANQGAKKPGVT
jgi:hypothetical protein